MEKIDIETRLSRITSYVFALEELLVAVVNSMPNRNQIVRVVEQEGKVLDDLVLQEPLDDEQLQGLQEARLRVLGLISKA